MQAKIIAPQSCKILQTFVWRGAQTSNPPSHPPPPPLPTKQAPVKLDFGELFLCYFLTSQIHTWHLKYIPYASFEAFFQPF